MAREPWESRTQLSVVHPILRSGMEALTRNWWAVMMRGLVAVLLGIVGISASGHGIAELVALFGFYTALYAGFSFLAAVRAAREECSWAPLVVDACLALFVSVVTFAFPGQTHTSMRWVIGLWAICSGVLDLLGAYRLRKAIPREWVLGVSGAITIAFGISVFLMRQGPEAGRMILAFGLYGVLYGVSQVGLGFRLAELRARFAPHEQEA